MILKIKKPNYLDNSKWELRHGRKVYCVKISDRAWLSSLKGRGVDIRPGDFLRADVKFTIKYDHNNEVIGTEYELTKIIEIIKPQDNLWI